MVIMPDTIAVNTVVQRRLAGSAGVGLGVGLSAGILALLAALVYGALRLKRRPKGEARNVQVTKVDSDTSADASDEASHTSELDLMDSCIDVHMCASASCNVCRKEQSPDFVAAPQVPPEITQRIRSVNYRWWDKAIDEESPPTTV